MFKLIVAFCLLGVTYGGIFGGFGGWKNVDANSQTITELTETAVEHLNEAADGLYYRGLVEVKSAKQQVVNGIKYEVTFVLGETHCAKADSGAKLCEIPANAAKQECVVTFWKESTAVITQIVSTSCAEL